NHVHLILIPPDKHSMTDAVSEIHRRYTQMINSRNGWSGHLWQGRFYSVPLDDSHWELARAYVENNPVRAGLVADVHEYLWCSKGTTGLGAVSAEACIDYSAIRKMTATGRPIGSESFRRRIFAECGIDVTPRKAGRPAASANKYDVPN